jgi:hypothetical protein
MATLRAFSCISIKQTPMDFVERWFGFSGGRADGSLEAIFLVVLFMIILVISTRLLYIRKTKNDTRQKTRNRFFRGL